MARALQLDAASLVLAEESQATRYRQSNLLRHHFVRWPLVNYTQHKGSFLVGKTPSNIKIDHNKAKYSPRFVNFDECLLLAPAVKATPGKTIEFEIARDLYEQLNGRELPVESATYMDVDAETKYRKYIVGDGDADLHSSIQIALANVPVAEDDIVGSYLGRPNLSRKRIKVLFQLLNSVAKYRTAAKKQIDLLIFPEVSIPYAWEAIVVQWARKRNIGVICGLEHRISNNCAFNTILAALPFETENKTRACLPIRRLKRRYSPGEQFDLINHQLSVPEQEMDKERYQLISWRGATFTIYNCYELACIAERAIFMGKIDFLVASEWNKDTNYFANIVEAAARDLHCYVIQVNNSKFGDTRVIYPSKTEMKSPMEIKGGDNTTFLTMSIDLQSLRDFQRKGFGLQKECGQFKPTPPGMDTDDVLDRISLKKDLKNKPCQ